MALIGAYSKKGSGVFHRHKSYGWLTPLNIIWSANLQEGLLCMVKPSTILKVEEEIVVDYKDAVPLLRQVKTSACKRNSMNKNSIF